MSAEQIFNAEGIKALVVDDNEVNAMVVSTMLEQLSIRVVESYSGKDAIEKAKYEDFDIIFMDYLMPEMNGIEATEEIRRLGKVKRPVIIALSANETQELRKKFEQAGVDDVMAKPLEPDMVYQIMKKWVPEQDVSQYVMGGTKAEKQSDDVGGLKEIFSAVPGLDVEKGLSHLANSEENYVKVLEAAVDNIRTQQKRLKVYSQSQVQPSSMKISFHSLKGVFLNLGVEQLSEQSQLLELACSSNSLELLESNLSEYLAALENFIRGIEEGLVRFCDDYAEMQKERYQPISEEEFKECLEQLVYDLRKYEYNDLRELVQRLLYASKGEERRKYERVKKAIQGFQYEEALQILGYE